MMQKKDKERTQKMSRKQQEDHKKNMDLPVNRFLNAVNEDGTHKYPIAKTLWEYHLLNPDPVLNDMRMANSLLHEVRWRKDQSVKYLLASKTKGETEMFDKNGKMMDKEDCYLAHISFNVNIHLAISKLREHLGIQLLAKCDGAVFTFEQYNEYLLKFQKIVKELGYELFPKKVDLIEPL